MSITYCNPLFVALDHLSCARCGSTDQACEFYDEKHGKWHPRPLYERQHTMKTFDQALGTVPLCCGAPRAGEDFPALTEADIDALTVRIRNRPALFGEYRRALYSNW